MAYRAPRDAISGRRLTRFARARRSQDRPLLKQQGIDTTPPAGKALFGMMGVFAAFERSMIQERVRAGLERARRDGKRLGRPPLDVGLQESIQDALRVPGRPGVRRIAQQFGVNASTVQRISSGI
jgi:DNA invertase Pin-like site-specific DNA recombinase